MGYIGNQADANFSSIDKQVITGNGGTGYTLSHSVANANEIAVYVNNVRQDPGVAYTVNNAALTMTGAVANTDSFYVVFLGKAVQTKVPPDGSVSTAKLASGIAISASTGTFSGNVGIKTTSPESYYAKDLVLNALDEGGITIAGNGANQQQYLMFADGTSGAERFRGYIGYDHNPDMMQMVSGGSTKFLVNDTAEAMRINSSGNVGIGTTSPSDLVHLKGGSDNTSTGAPIIRLQKQSGGAVDDGQTIGGISWFVNDDGVDSGASKERAKIIAESQNGSSGTRLEFWTGNSNAAIAERMRIIADGNVCIGGTTHDPISVASSSMAISQNGDFNINKASGTAAYMGRSGSDGNLMVFYKNTTFVGGISLNSSSTSFNTSSDYRLKENVDYTWDATTRLKQLKPARFNFIADDTNTLVDGFLAHEVSSIVPEAITGTKDAMTAKVLYAEGDELPEGKSVGDVKKPSVIDPQGIDQSKLVPLLVKTIQELEARITALEA